MVTAARAKVQAVPAGEGCGRGRSYGSQLVGAQGDQGLEKREVDNPSDLQGGAEESADQTGVSVTGSSIAKRQL